MHIADQSLFILLVILTFTLIAPEIFKRLKIPFVTSLIIIGAILGPHALNYIQTNEIINFFGFLGMTFLMLMAGLETDFAKLKELKYKIIILSTLNGLIPFSIGLFLTYSFGYSILTSTIIGIIFISSSIAIVIPILKETNLLKKDIGQIILSSVMLNDIVSLILLTFLLQTVNPISKLPLSSFFILLIISIGVLFYLMPRLTDFFLHKRFLTKTGYEKKLRFLIVLVIGFIAYFSALGVHPILGAFIIGLTLSEVVRHEHIFNKLHTLGYGLFVPVFFFIIGMQMDLKIIGNFDITEILMVSLIVGLILSKFFSGYIAAKIVKLTNKQASIYSISTIPQLTTTLAVTYAAASTGILDDLLVTSLILLSIITTIISPILLKYIIHGRRKFHWPKLKI